LSLTLAGLGYCLDRRQLGLHGASVVLMGRREAVLTKAVEGLSKEGISARWIRGDVRSQEDAQKAVAAATQAFGKLNILVNCAAGNFLAVAEMLSPKGFRTVLDIDAVGTFTMCGACFPALKAAGGGIIINISAVLHHGATWYQAHASAAKAAIDSLTRSLALEWGEFNIRVCGIAPGPTDGTPGLTKLAPGVDSESVREIVEGVIPLGRLGTKGDMALAAVFLASPAGHFITGDTLAVDGGQRLFKEKMIPREVVGEEGLGIMALGTDKG
jgi:peroxisomal 2,4-dienoyl-CoA reductase